jgi:hypothetical protein
LKGIKLEYWSGGVMGLRLLGSSEIRSPMLQYSIIPSFQPMVFERFRDLIDVFEV